MDHWIPIENSFVLGVYSEKDSSQEISSTNVDRSVVADRYAAIFYLIADKRV